MTLAPFRPAPKRERGFFFLSLALRQVLFLVSIATLAVKCQDHAVPTNATRLLRDRVQQLLQATTMS
jgi:hypothetical protein